ncbi:MAG TPA: Wzz/FepE/Etk N-terminal domain-containing protein [Roseiflexaceae bacterium]
MELHLYLDILRRRWPLVVAVPLLVALVSLAVAVMRPPRYGLTARLLVTRPPTGNVDAEDTLAYDLPAIVGGKSFAQDVARELTSRGHPLDEALVEQALHAENQKHVVYLSATTDGPAAAVAIADAAVALIKANGLRYWGDLNATPEHPGANVAVLDLPAGAALLNGPRAIAQEVALRALLGLLAGVGAAFALYYLDEGRMADDQWRIEDRE